MTNDILARSLSRASNPDTIHDMAQGLSPAPQIVPPASPEQLATAEANLGFALPTLLRRIYTEVGNGGFGPGYGLMGLEELLQSYAELRQLPGWPGKMVPLCTWGCGIYSCVDCSAPSAPVFVYNPDTHVLDGHGITGVTLTSAGGEALWTYKPDPPVPEANDMPGGVRLSLHKPSLQEWVAAWVDEQDLWAEMTALP